MDSFARQGEADDGDFKENMLIRWSRRVLPISKDYDGAQADHPRPRTGKRIFTPMLIVMIAIGTTDLIFALDSIPAIFGLTTEPYLVFTANVFALMGLRQLYFLLGGLLDRLVYLSIGLAVVLGFIGVKLVLEALPTTTCRSSTAASRSPACRTSASGVSLAVIIGMLAIATVASLIKSSRDAKKAKA